MAKIRLCGNTIEFNGYIVGTLFENEVPATALDAFKTELLKSECKNCNELQSQVESLESRLDNIRMECD